MPKVGDAKAAMKNLNGKDIAGSKIRVKKAEDKPEPTSSPQQPTAFEPVEQPKLPEKENKANSPWQRKK
jgi:RNA recognition motif-containing protein